jgi:hypothetical protein
LRCVPLKVCPGRTNMFLLAGRLSVPAESGRWQIDRNLMNITTSRDEPGLTATTGIDHCLWHHGGCSSATALQRRFALQASAVTGALRETSSRRSNC